MTNLKVSHNKLAEDLTNTKELLKKTRQELDSQKMRNIWLEVHSRRNNIKVFNVQETEESSGPVETERVLKDLLQSPLKMRKKEMENLEFERVHCILTQQTSDASQTKPCPILAKWSFFKDKGYIFKQVKKIHKDLKINNTYWCSRRLPEGSRRNLESTVA